MQLIINLFWLGLWICVALFIFNMVIGFVFGAIGMFIGSIIFAVKTLVNRIKRA